jgi:hypothetical protein
LQSTYEFSDGTRQTNWVNDDGELWGRLECDDVVRPLPPPVVPGWTLLTTVGSWDKDGTQHTRWVSDDATLWVTLQVDRDDVVASFTVEALPYTNRNTGVSGRLGRITAHTLRTIPFGALADAARRRPYQSLEPRDPIVFEREAAPPPGKRGHTDEHYAKFAARYVAWTNAGGLLRDFAKSEHMSEPGVRYALDVARARELFVRTRGGRRRGGHLSPSAMSSSSSSALSVARSSTSSTPARMSTPGSAG